MTPQRAAGAIALVFGLAAGAPLEAQSLSGASLVYNVEDRVLYRGAVEQQSGVWIGGEGALQMGVLHLGVVGLFGTLRGGDPLVNPDQTVRASSVTLSLAPVRGLLVGAEAEARRFSSDAGTTTWRLLGVHARSATGLGITGLAGTAEASYFISAQVIGGADRLNPALRATLGVAYQSPRGPLQIHLGYRFERFDFEVAGAAPARQRQFRGVVAGLGLRLGRR